VINPLVNWIWIGWILLAIGTVIAFMPDRAYALAAKLDKEKAATIVSLLFLLFAATAHAQMEAAGDALHDPRNDSERALFQKLKCTCGTCMHALDECGGECGMAATRRFEIQKMLDQNKPEQEILDFEVSKYGTETLRMPVDKGINRLAWLLPYGVFLGAAGFLVGAARRWTRKSAAAAAAPPPTASAQDDSEYSDKLDDELDKLD